MRAAQTIGIAIIAVAQTHSLAATWTGPATGVWENAANWDAVGDTNANGIPDASTEDARIDNNPSQNTTVGFTIASATMSSINVGHVVVDSGDALNLSKTGTNSRSITFASLANSGTIGISSSWGGNNDSFNVIATSAPDSPAVLNAAGGTITLTNSTSRNNDNITLTVPGTNINAGAITVKITLGGSGSAGSANLAPAGTGAQTFTNNGTMRFEASTSNSNVASLARLNVPANQQLTLGGTGELTLASGTSGANPGPYAKIVGGASATLTNGASHVILGSGMIGDGTFTSITNDGLIRSTGTNGVPLVINSSTGTITNAGRIVADSTGGVFIGSNTAARTLSSTGLLEARAGSSLTIGTQTTGAIAGDVRGGGTIVATNLSLATSASLTPGNSVNVTGVGASSVGTLTLNGGLILAEDTALNFQLGADDTAGTTYDSVNVVNALTLNGVLNVAALTGFDVGTYRLFTYSSETALLGSGLSLGIMPEGYSYAFDTATAGAVNLVVTEVPEPAAAGLMALGLFASLGRRRRRA